MVVAYTPPFHTTKTIFVCDLSVDRGHFHMGEPLNISGGLY